MYLHAYIFCSIGVSLIKSNMQWVHCHICQRFPIMPDPSLLRMQGLLGQYSQSRGNGELQVPGRQESVPLRFIQGLR